MELIFGLLICFQVKHFVADYPLQTPYMLNKFKPGWEFFFPLLAHCSVHACMTFTLVFQILYTFDPDISFWNSLEMAGWMGILDFTLHCIMDRIKAGPKYLGRFKDMMDKKFWWSLGFDQMIHHLTHYLIIFIILQYLRSNT